jgi:hypothetical protein
VPAETPAIFLRADADMVFFLGMLTTLGFCGPLFARAFAHRALWAAAILALPAAEIMRLAPVRLPYVSPSSATSTASSCSTVLAA